MTTRLYYHKTDGGAEYLCASPVKGTDEGDLYTAIIRLDGEPELLNPYAQSELLDALHVAKAIIDKDIDLTDEDYEQITRAIQKAEGKA